MALNMQRVAEVKTKVGSSMFGDISKLVDGRNVLRLFSFEHVIRKVLPKRLLSDKTEFLIFDHWQNFWFFDEKYRETQPAPQPQDGALGPQVHWQVLRKL